MEYWLITVQKGIRRGCRLPTVFILLLALISCTKSAPQKPIPEHTLPPLDIHLRSSLEIAPQFKLSRHAGIFTVYGVEGDDQAIEDVAIALETQAPKICQQLGYDYQHPITVELFPDQDSLDRHGMNQNMRSYYAYSGDYRIQMVSPRNPTPVPEIGYSQRVLIAVHEFVHLVNNAINPDMPPWLNEGVAVYIGPHDLYTYVCRHAFPFEQVPSFAEMEKSYDLVPAADLFAYSLVDFIVAESGSKALNRLIRSPESFEEILDMTRIEFEQKWWSYLNEHYANQ